MLKEMIIICFYLMLRRFLIVLYTKLMYYSVSFCYL